MRKLFLTVLPSLALMCVAQPAFAQSRIEIPDAFVQELLIKNTFAAVNQANLTGNYTVLSDLASSGLRSRSRGADLEQAFRGLREQKIDMSPVLCLRPQLTQRPALDAAGRLRLVGQFATQPLALQFNLVFQHTAAGWMLDDISIGTVRSQPVNAQSNGNTPTAGTRTANYGHSEAAHPRLTGHGPALGTSISYGDQRQAGPNTNTQNLRSRPAFSRSINALPVGSR